MTLVDPNRYHNSVDQLAALHATVVAGAHNPLITATDIPLALRIIRGLPTADVPPAPDQAVLDAIVGQAAALPPIPHLYLEAKGKDMTTVDETVACTLAGTERMPSRFAETPTVTRASSDQTSGARASATGPSPPGYAPHVMGS